MKRAMILMLVAIMIMSLSVSVFAARPAHPPVPELSLPMEAGAGLHTAWFANISENVNGLSNHVFMYFLSPH